MAMILLLVMMIGVVDMRHEFERPSRVVTLKQGRVQGRLRDLPLQQTSSGGNDVDEPYRYNIYIRVYHTQVTGYKAILYIVLVNLSNLNV